MNINDPNIDQSEPTVRGDKMTKAPTLFTSEFDYVLLRTNDVFDKRGSQSKNNMCLLIRADFYS
jgi:hypothetical protein